MKKIISISIIIIGAVLFVTGLFTQIPSKELTTYSLLEDDYSVIEEYVGGDAYNYMIGASLVGGEIAGAKTQKTVFIAVGLLIICLGLYALSLSKENNMFAEENNVLAETAIALTENKDSAEVSCASTEENEVIENREIITES